uniref:Wall-associated serine/threonine kinase n=1 Tax=Oryza sativa subsp. japonica TaxID=39947 RepID=Q6K4J3_ORYSJ|nr:putative wall-associated serine/threonine kinase [Oryza sativa Japonica Group]
MERHQLLLLPGCLLLYLGAIATLAAADVAIPAGGQPPGCRTRCGDVDIPYPFGIIDPDRPDCAYSRGFQLNCTSVNGAARPMFHNIEVTNISVPNGKAWMKTNISSQCFDPETNRTLYDDIWNSFRYSPYWLSNEDNKLIVVGCNSLAYMRSTSFITRQSMQYVIGCSSTCDNVDLKNGSCSGAGCCQADIPKGIRYYQGYFNANYNTTAIWRSSPCNYMVVMETSAFNFSTTYVDSTVFSDTYKGMVPTVLDWTVEWKKCEEAKENRTSYACVSSNSYCVDATNGRGYRCKCSDGYKGNPYITDGCEGPFPAILIPLPLQIKRCRKSIIFLSLFLADIDECQDAHPCTGICINTQGSYTCTCQRGKHLIDGVCKQSSSSWIIPVIGGSIGVVTLVTIVTCAYLIQERNKLHSIKQKYFRQHGGRLLFEEMKGTAFKIFTEEELQKATNNFDEKKILGHGGHGTVYKGFLNGNTEVAIKRCKTIDEQQKKEFGKEMVILSQVNHKNIVKLLGCCLEVEVPILVYEFIANGTLFHLIHDGHGRHISISTRLQIAHQSAEALAYLHSWASPPILHGDVKSSNILLDGDFTAKVSDFGASILSPTDDAQFVTFVQGTRGYLDPEYMQTWKLTDKSDVYSFGVVVLELLTRKKPLNFDGLEDEKSLSVRFLSAVKENKLEEILDDQIKSEENMEILEEIAELARRCLEMCGENRPSMKEVAEKLDSLRKVLHHPWALHNLEEAESLLGESSIVSSEVVSTGNFSIEKKSLIGLESGR